MMHYIRSLFGTSGMRSRGRYGVFGNIARSGVAGGRRYSRRGMGRMYRSGRSRRRGGFGVSTLLGLGALVLGSVFGVRRLTSTSHRIQSRHD